MFASDLYIKAFNNKFVRIVFVASSEEQANHFMKTNPCCGVLKELGHLVFIAHNDDLGKKIIDDKTIKISSNTDETK